jgi:hypothetical protein
MCLSLPPLRLKNSAALRLGDISDRRRMANEVIDIPGNETMRLFGRQGTPVVDAGAECAAASQHVQLFLACKDFFAGCSASS